MRKTFKIIKKINFSFISLHTGYYWDQNYKFIMDNRLPSLKTICEHPSL